MTLSLACNLHVILPIILQFNAIDAIGINQNTVSEAIFVSECMCVHVVACFHECVCSSLRVRIRSPVSIKKKTKTKTHK